MICVNILCIYICINIHMYVAARGLCTLVTVVAFPDLTDAITMFSDVITVYWYVKLRNWGPTGRKWGCGVPLIKLILF